MSGTWYSQPILNPVVRGMKRVIWYCNLMRRSLALETK